MKEQAPAPVVRIAASYARKSNANQLAVEDQHAVNIKAAERDGFHIPPHLCFSDDDTSGVTTRRKGWDQVWNIVESGNAPFERLYAVKKDRIGRFKDPGRHDYIRIHFQEHGVELRYSQGPNPDYSKGLTAEARVHAVDDRYSSIQAHTEWETIRQRARVGLRTQAKNGFYPGANAPYGTVRCLAHAHTRTIVQVIPDGLKIRADDHRYLLQWRTDGTVDVVKRIFDMVDLEDLSLQKIAAILQAEGTPPPRLLSEDESADPSAELKILRWERKSVFFILRNPIYQGDLVWGRSVSDLPPVLATLADTYGEEPILYPNFIADPPISREQFARVQERLDQRSESHSASRHSRQKYLLTGRLMCAACGAPWGGHESSRKDKHRRRYYRHGTNGTRTPGGTRTVSCASEGRYVRAADLEQQVVTDVLLNVCNDDVRAAVLAELERQASNADLDEQKLAQIDRSITDTLGHMKRAARSLSEATNDDVAKAHQSTIDHHAGTLHTLRRQREDLVLARERAEVARQNLSKTVPKMAELLKGFHDATDQQKKSILRTLIDRIALDADNQAVTVDVVLGVTKVQRKKTTGPNKTPGKNEPEKEGVDTQ